MKTLLLLLALASSLPATTMPLNDLATLSGDVITEEGQPLEYATVSAYAPDSTLAEGTVTDASGHFELSLPAGAYTLRIEFIGFATKNVPVDVRRKTDLGTITIGTDALTLDAVEVRAEKSNLELKLDKKVFNVGKDALAQGGDATDVLAQVPAVTVSAEGAVSLRGNSSVRILINGRPSALADNGSLDGIPSASIEKVELITNPSAKYEASGSAGIINIVLKKSAERGYGGSVTLATGFPADHRISVNGNYRHEKFNAFATVGGRYANFRGDGDLTRTSTLEGQTTNLLRIPDMDRHDDAYSVYTGFDYNVSEEATFTASYSLYDMINDDITYNDYAYTDAANDRLRDLRQVQDYLEPGKYQQLDLIYNQKFPASKSELTLQFSHDRWRETEQEDVTIEELFPNPTEIVRYQTESDEASTDYRLQGDFEMPLGENHKVEIGLRGETRLISADYFADRNTPDGFEPIPGFNANEFDYYEQIGAAYLQYAYEKEAFGLQIGMRGEYTDIETENSSQEVANLRKNYLQLFPSASLQYKLSAGSSTQLSYSRRIRRPSFGHLNPFGGIRLPSVQFSGNPDLDPALTDRVELNFLMTKEKFTINPAVFTSLTKGDFVTIIEQNPANIFGLEDGTITMIPANLERETIYGAELDLGYRPSDKFNFNFYFFFYGNATRGNIGERNFDVDFSSWDASIRGQLRLPKDLSLQTRIGYRAPSESAQTRVPGTFNGNAAISKEWKNKYTLTLRVNAPRYFIEETFRPSFEQRDFFQWTGWRFGASFQYRFEQGASSRERRQRGSIR